MNTTTSNTQARFEKETINKEQHAAASRFASTVQQHEVAKAQLCLSLYQHLIKGTLASNQQIDLGIGTLAPCDVSSILEYFMTLLFSPRIADASFSYLCDCFSHIHAELQLHYPIVWNTQHLSVLSVSLPQTCAPPHSKLVHLVIVILSRLCAGIENGTSSVQDQSLQPFWTAFCSLLNKLHKAMGRTREAINENKNAASRNFATSSTTLPPNPNSVDFVDLVLVDDYMAFLLQLCHASFLSKNNKSTHACILQDATASLVFFLIYENHFEFLPILHQLACAELQVHQTNLFANMYETNLELYDDLVKMLRQVISKVGSFFFFDAKFVFLRYALLVFH